MIRRRHRRVVHCATLSFSCPLLTINPATQTFLMSFFISRDLTSLFYLQSPVKEDTKTSEEQKKEETPANAEEQGN